MHLSLSRIALARLLKLLKRKQKEVGYSISIACYGCRENFVYHVCHALNVLTFQVLSSRRHLILRRKIHPKRKLGILENQTVKCWILIAPLWSLQEKEVQEGQVCYIRCIHWGFIGICLKVCYISLFSPVTLAANKANFKNLLESDQEESDEDDLVFTDTNNVVDDVGVVAQKE